MKKYLLVVLMCLLLCSCSDKSTKVYDSVEKLDGKKVGFLTGTYQDEFVLENYPDVDMTFAYLNSTSELLMSLNSKKIDGFVIDTPIARLFVANNDGIAFSEIPGSNIDAGFIFSGVNKQLIDDFNDFIDYGKESGLLSELENKWIYGNATESRIEYKDYVPTKGTINVVSNSDSPPYCFVADGQLQGYSLEVLYEFGYYSGYGFNIDNANFDGILSGVTSNKYDMGVDCINMTEERMKSITFSKPFHINSACLVYLDNGAKVYKSPYELKDKKMGCMSGSIYDVTIKEKLDNSDIVYFNSRSELIMGLQSKKIEGYLADKPVAMTCCEENDGITYIDEPLEYVDYGFCFSSDASNIRLEFNDYLQKCQNDGSLQELQNKWFNGNAINIKTDDIKLSGKKGTIKVCTTPDAAPFSFVKDNKYEGYEVELLYKFANEYGYDVQIDSVSFDAIISAVSSNKYDVAFNGIYITEERERSVDFSIPTYSSSVVAIVRSGNVNTVSFIDSIKDKFYRTFVEEDRYKIILNGIFTTLLITASSLFFGTLFGFIVFLLTRKLGKWFTKLSDVVAYIVDGLPVVVLLMILFYIIFAKSTLSGEIISIIGFSLIICYSVYGLLKTGVGAIDVGQFEGALALGYTDNQTLFKFVMPQALRIVMPSYRSAIVSLIKSSSIVGYVTVQDLTRASDLIRSRTYDAFFPLIVTAVIYFILAWLLTKIVNKIQIKFLPNEKTKEEILKSINK